MQVKVEPIVSIRLLLQACTGVLLGFFLALLVAKLCWPVGGRYGVMPESLLPWIAHNMLYKPREKGFFLLCILFSTAGGYLFTSKLYQLKSLFLLFFLICSMPLANFFAHNILQEDNSFSLLIVLLIPISLFFVYRLFKGHEIKPVSMNTRVYRFSWKPYLSFLFFMLLLLWPSSFKTIAASISGNIEKEMHTISFIAGIALYYLGDHILPGIDYFTQYSIGMGWLFSHMLAKSAERTLVNYVIFHITCIGLFYALALYVLHWLYRSWATAGLITFLSLILLFHNPPHFYDPASGILHYPLMGVCAGLLAFWIKNPTQILRCLLLSSALALSIFFNTETGVIFSVAVVIASLFSASRFSSMVLPLVWVGIASIIILTVLLISIFGFGVLQYKFWFALVEPFFIYGKLGYSGVWIFWTFHDLNWFYNLVAPGVAFATLPLIIREASSSDADRPRLAMLAFFTISGLLMLMKFVNMSLIAVWHVNSLGLLVALGWWSQVIFNRIKQTNFTFLLFSSSYSVSAIKLFYFILVVFMLGITIVNQDSRNRAPYGLRSWVRYPALITAPFRDRKDCNDYSCFSNQPAASDVALITSRTKPGEQVAIIDHYDWGYLIAAHRPPLVTFLISDTIFTKDQVKGTLTKLKESRYLFLSKGKNGEPYMNSDDFNAALLPTFHQVYEYDGEGERLVAWRKR